MEYAANQKLEKSNCTNLIQPDQTKSDQIQPVKELPNEKVKGKPKANRRFGLIQLNPTKSNLIRPIGLIGLIRPIILAACEPFGRQQRQARPSYRTLNLEP